MLQCIKPIQAKKSTIYNSFLYGARVRDYNFTTNKILHIYSQNMFPSILGSSHHNLEGSFRS